MKDTAKLQARMEKALANNDMEAFNAKVREVMNGRQDHTGVTVALVMEITKKVINNFEDYYPKQAKAKHKRLAKLIGSELVGNIVGFKLVNAAAKNQVRYKAVKETAELLSDVALELTLKDHDDPEIKRAAKSLKAKFGAEFVTKALHSLQEKAGVDIEDEEMMFQFTQNLMFNAMADSELFMFGLAMNDDGTDMVTTITFNEVALQKIGYSTQKLAEDAAQFRPMVSTPKDWTSVRSGGYYTDGFHMPVVNARGKRQEVAEYEKMLDNDPRFQRFLEAINEAQHTPFRVNQDAYKLVREIERRGLGMLDIPADEKVKVDQKRICRLYGQLLRASRAGKPQAELDKLHKSMQKVKVEAFKKDVSRNSKLEDCRRTIRTAGKFRMFKEIFFVYQADFRGRLYNTCPTLSTQGSDLSKGLLQFAKGKELGEDGYFWLCIHAANTYGGPESLDKKSFVDRFAFINDNPELIKTVSDGDIDNPKFVEIMKDAENPVMFYATCRELAQLINMSEDERKYFVSYLPVGMDGTCNGQQWAAGFLRSHQLAENVNLVASTHEDKPNDLYRSVANGMIKFLNRAGNKLMADLAPATKKKETKKGKKNVKK